MNWTIIGIVGIGLSVLVWIVALIKVSFFDKAHPSPNKLDEYDENHPKDFDLVRKYSKKITYFIVALSLAITIAGIGWAIGVMEKQNTTKDYGESQTQGFVSGEHLADRMGVTFVVCVPLTGIWIANIMLLTKWQRKEGTSLDKHYELSN